MAGESLQRFVDAQSDVYGAVLEELRRGRKRSHWMWFVFPQVRGLGSSATAQRYALDGVADARAYLSHPVLGPRLLACVDILLGLEGATAEAIFGHPDCLKLRSCLTLFALAAPAEARFGAALDKYFGGQADPLTLRALDNGGRISGRDDVD